MFNAFVSQAFGVQGWPSAAAAAAAATASAGGTSTATATGQAVIARTVTAAGAGASSVVGLSFFAGVGAASGASAATAYTSGVIGSVGIAAGSGASTATGRSFFSAVATAIGAGAAAATGQQVLVTTDAIGTAVGVGAAASLSFYFGASASVLEPDADNVTGGWKNETGGTTLYPSISESTPNDANYIISSNILTTDTCKVSLSDPSGGIVAPFAVIYRFKKQGATPINLRVRLMQDTTQITSWTHTNIDVNFLTVEQVLTSGELASINDQTKLFLEFQATA